MYAKYSYKTHYTCRKLSSRKNAYFQLSVVLVLLYNAKQASNVQMPLVSVICAGWLSGIGGYVTKSLYRKSVNGCQNRIITYLLRIQNHRKAAKSRSPLCNQWIFISPWYHNVSYSRVRFIWVGTAVAQHVYRLTYMYWMNTLQWQKERQRLI